MICIHARTYKEPYNVPAQWEHLYELKKTLSIPVLGNGGIDSLQDGLDKTNNLDGFLIGQASFGNPWVFSLHDKPYSFIERLPVILKHSEWLIESKGEKVGTREIRKHLLSYVKGFRGAKEYRSKITHVGSYDDIVKTLDLIKNESH